MRKFLFRDLASRPVTTPMLCLALSLCTAGGGCRLGADGDLDAYASYGGIMPRTQRDSGRVGSIFDPAGTHVANLKDRNAPEQDDAAIRQREESERQRGQPAPAPPTDGQEPGQPLRDRSLEERTPEQREQQDREARERLEGLNLQDIDYVPQSDERARWAG